MAGIPQSEPTAQVTIHKAMDELKRRQVNIESACSRCNFDSWSVDLLEGPATSLMTSALSVTTPPYYPGTGATTLTVLAIVCQRCGYTIFHNAQVLGVLKVAE